MRNLSVALIQTTTSADALAALDHLTPLIERAAEGGAKLILTPECSNLMEQRRAEKAAKVTTEAEDICVRGLMKLARMYGVTILMGSAIVKSQTDDKAVNRALLIGPDGEIAARYDKIHLFDADMPDGKSYRESKGICAGDKAVVIDAAGARLGLSICYDVRFAPLYRTLAQGNDKMPGAEVIAINAAFTVPTGQAHWEVLLRARAIETGCFVLAAAQGGQHEDGRTTYGHSMVVDPWGRVIASLDHDRPDVLFATLDLAEVTSARLALPQLTHDRMFVLS
jgi:deaminated glutathione amidase